MKKINTILAILVVSSVFFSWHSSAQTPEKMSYQAVLRNNSNSLVANTQIGMKISILKGTETGTVVYNETQTSSTNANGLVSIEIGSGTTNDDFSAIDWANGPYFLKTETDPTGGTNYSITGTSQLMSVPYALYAKTADNITALPKGTKAGDMLYWKDSAWVEIGAPSINGTILTFCNDRPVWTTDGTCPPLAIGDSYGGGIIAYIFESGDPGYIEGETHGLIVGPHLSPSKWGAGGVGVDTETDLGTGAANTVAIVNAIGENGSYAAKQCVDLVYRGYDDWYLGSRDEMYKIFLSQSIIGELGGGRHWTSSSSSSYYAYFQDFHDDGYRQAEIKSSNFSVLAIRSF